MDLAIYDPFFTADVFRPAQAFRQLVKQMEKEDQPQWVPRADVTEKEKEWQIDVDIPGMDKKDVKISVEKGNQLKICGERKYEHEEKNDRFTRLERSFGSFQKSWTLPENTDVSAIRASSENGVLKIAVPKPEKKDPVSMEIEVQ